MPGISCFVKRCYGSEKKRTINPLVLISNNQNIYFNLSLENFILTNYNELLNYLNVNTIEKYNKPVLFLWRNNKSIIIGKNQNIWSECDLDNIKKNNVLVARRFTGGGAVYHDLGNLCFTFLNNNINKNNNYNIILNTLKSHFNIDAKLHGRNDITVNDKKCSGSAFKNIKDVFLHHGTILIDIEKNVLNKYLTPNKIKYIKHGVASVNARTVNLKEINSNITCENLCIALIKEFQKFYNIFETNPNTKNINSNRTADKNGEIFEGISDNFSINNVNQQNNTSLINNNDVISNNLNVHYIDTNQNIIKNPQFLKYYNLLKDWDWCYGKTPKFQNTFCKQFNFGRLEICFDVKNGLIKDGNVFSDALDINLIDQLKLIFNNDIKYTKESINDFLKNIKVENKESLEEITSWILEEL
ncbi:lipoate-protein ligase 1 [Plasmodium berghei]|uniref:lipoate--protein ligase n=2 Tax=Plasmodium berghei TaxID=5821 RepID=A0A509AQ18_PLABA|nr:lipoate-protein ligase 1 [Plasmodium berghei ANKA]CXJ13642.1 lipoate-protein ligase 1 [Plasmodium berghei]SCM26145.1 lipoate-protein ligase 1 [Plasmodium berghei]SCN28301.1 lipoate-protein ligase 1 [Plasmodium berghei]SCO62499.1 lipoate-protein ligase 1 [Plasmodium berghei]SCO64057.1 lipoate-protein ligase 1 [Plasmodium berghei]|eukprot:XP_034423953.1 lipoate-protein ligase 1 [Plasmodium berghei ANKA]